MWKSRCKCLLIHTICNFVNTHMYACAEYCTAIEAHITFVSKQSKQVEVKA